MPKNKHNESEDDIFGGVKNIDSLPECEDEEIALPEKLNICQWIIIALLYLILAFLVGFIIYISCTWTKDRTNEYT